MEKDVFYEYLIKENEMLRKTIDCLSKEGEEKCKKMEHLNRALDHLAALVEELDHENLQYLERDGYKADYEEKSAEEWKQEALEETRDED